MMSHKPPPVAFARTRYLLLDMDLRTLPYLLAAAYVRGVSDAKAAREIQG